MCVYKKSSKELPFPRILYAAECGYQLAIMEGYEFNNSKNSNGTQEFSVRSSRLNLPSGKCNKCGGGIEI